MTYFPNGNFACFVTLHFPFIPVGGPPFMETVPESLRAPGARQEPLLSADNIGSVHGFALDYSLLSNDSGERLAIFARVATPSISPG